MRIHDKIICPSDVAKDLKNIVGDFVEKWEYKKGMIVGVAKRGLGFDQTTSNQLTSKLKTQATVSFH